MLSEPQRLRLLFSNMDALIRPRVRAPKRPGKEVKDGGAASPEIRFPGRYSLCEIDPVAALHQQLDRIRPSSATRGEVCTNCATGWLAPSGSATWKAKTSSGSRTQSTGLPSTVKRRPANRFTDPLRRLIAESLLTEARGRDGRSAAGRRRCCGCRRRGRC